MYVQLGGESSLTLSAARTRCYLGSDEPPVRDWPTTAYDRRATTCSARVHSPSYTVFRSQLPPRRHMLDIPPPRASGFTTTTSVALYWCSYGIPGARRLLVLHGGPGADHRYLLPQMLELDDEHELVFYDQRGGGQSRTDDPTPITW